MKKLNIGLVALLLSSSVSAMQMPSIQQSTSSDRVSVNGFSCEQAIASTVTGQVGVFGANGNDNYDSYSPYDRNYSDRDRDEVGIYAQIQFSLGKTPERIDCKRMYDLELRAREMEVAQLKNQIELLKSTTLMEK